MVPVTSPTELALRAAVRGGEAIRASVLGRETAGGAPAPAATAKGLPGDYVTDVDLASERAIRELLEAESPGTPMLGEEAGGPTPGGRYWLVDPLDGTTNFVHGFPVVGVSVALVDAGRPVAGCVHAPLLGLTYAAGRGAGAWEHRADGSRARLSVSERDPAHAVVATGFPFRRKELLPRYLRVMEAALDRVEDLRRPGAASMDLAWVAAGVFDGFFELGLSPWDVAAGGLLVEEAGGVVTDWAGAPDYLPGSILAGAPAVHAELLRIVEEQDAAHD